MIKKSQKLDAVSKARQAFVLARTTLEQRLRDEMKQELSNLQTQVDITVRYAIDAGESKASVLRAMGTKDYNTLMASLERTQGVSEISGTDPLKDVYTLIESFDEHLILVRYEDHGINKANGVSEFAYRQLEDGRYLFTASAPLWNDDYTVRNDAVALLDGKVDGYYYDELVAWLENS